MSAKPRRAGTAVSGAVSANYGSIGMRTQTEAPVRAGPGVLGGAGPCLVSSDVRKITAEEMDRVRELCPRSRESDTVGSAEPRSRTDLAGRAEAIPLET